MSKVTYTDGWRLSKETQRDNLPDEAKIYFDVNGREIRVYLEGDTLRIAADGQLVIEPIASNTVRVHSKDF